VHWTPGEWVEAPAAVECVVGIHACRTRDLARWIDDSLWEIELAGDIVEGSHKVIASRGRLLRRVPNYREVVRTLAEIGAWRSRDRAVTALRASGDSVAVARLEAVSTLDGLLELGGDADDATSTGRAVALAADAAYFAMNGEPSQSPFVAACSAGHALAGDDGDQATYDTGYGAERDFQSAWLAEHLDLTGSIG
jgi:hypothetical protein